MKAQAYEAGSRYNEAILEYDNVGKRYRSLSLYDSAYKYFLRALVIREEVNQEDLAMSYLYLGSINRMRHQYCEAVEHYYNAVRVANDSAEVFYGYNNLGSILVNVANVSPKVKEKSLLLDSAARMLDIAESYLRASPNKHWERSLYWNLGHLEANRQDFTKSREYFIRVIDMLNSDSTLRSDYDYASLFNNMGYAEMNLGNYDSAKVNLLHALEIAKSLNDLELQQLTLENLQLLHHRFDINQDSMMHYSFALDTVNYRILEVRNKSISADYQYQLMKAQFQPGRDPSLTQPAQWALVVLSIIVLALIGYIIQIKRSSN